MGRLNIRKPELKKVEQTWPTTAEGWKAYLHPKFDLYIKQEHTGQYCRDCKAEMIIKFSKRNREHFLACPNWPSCDGKSQSICVAHYAGQEVEDAYRLWLKEEKERLRQLKREQKKLEKEAAKKGIDDQFKAVVDDSIKTTLEQTKRRAEVLVNAVWYEGRC
jgi:ssDNA-binding Zn-finger/Zn-ribbon topoisomerase 1